METIISLIQKFIGNAPDYFTVGQSSSPQWNYGALLEYAFAGIVFILTIATVYKLLICLINRR